MLDHVLYWLSQIRIYMILILLYPCMKCCCFYDIVRFVPTLCWWGGSSLKIFCCSPVLLKWVSNALPTLKWINMHSKIYKIVYFTHYSIGSFRSWQHFLFLGNIEKYQENVSKVLNTFDNIMEHGAANAPFSIIFSDTLYFKGVKRRNCRVKG